MTVATYKQSDFTTQDPTTYRAALDADNMVATNIVDNFAAHAQATPNMTVQVDAGRLPLLGAVPAVIAAQNSATLTAPAAYPRYDIVYVDGATGVIGVATGAENTTPVDPGIPSGKIAIARLAMTVGMSSISNAVITDLRGPLLATNSSGGFLAVSVNTTLTVSQSGALVSLTGVGTVVTLPTPVGNTSIRYRLLGSDANTQTVTTAANSIIWPDGTTGNYSLTNNQLIEVESDGTNWRIIGRSGYTGDLVTYRAATPTTGYLFLNSAKTVSVQNTGSEVDVVGLPLGIVNGSSANHALARGQAFGVDQSWVDVSASRAGNTNYTNSTGKTITVLATVFLVVGGVGYPKVNGVLMGTLQNQGQSGCDLLLSFDVPSGATYAVTYGTGVANGLIQWFELR